MTANFIAAAKPAPPPTASALPTQPALPRSRDIATIAPELLVTTTGQRAIAFSRPLLWLAAYAAAAHCRWWLLVPPIMFCLFVAVVTATHDVVHGTLGLSRRQTELALFLLGAIVLESGHAYRTTHLQHHRVFPEHDDIEGEPAHMPLWKTLVYGPLYLPRLWLWAFRHLRRRADQRAWLLLEILLAPAGLLVGAIVWPRTPAVLAYAVLVVMGSWIYPLVTAKLQHSTFGNNPLRQSATLRGRLVPALLLNLSYHLEHHLYPQVPSHHVAELSRRLDPALRAAGVRPTQVP